ncbi:hypothetical protein ABIB80_007957, partial [Bradyrhizobium sp. i1.15.2]
YPHLPTLRLALKLDPRRIPATQQGGPPRRNTQIEEDIAVIEAGLARLDGAAAS